MYCISRTGQLCEQQFMPIASSSRSINNTLAGRQPSESGGTRVCEVHECRNGGRCEPLAGPSGATGSDYVCKCLPGFDGKKCERLATVSFRQFGMGQVRTRALV